MKSSQLIENSIIKLVFIILLIRGVYLPCYSQEGSRTRVKIGDIMYLDGSGNEHFCDFRQWDTLHPLGDLLGIVFYTRFVYDADSNKIWHGWVMYPHEGVNLMWAPQNSICYSNHIASYATSGVSTPHNPAPNYQNKATKDTCGWQNTYRLLDFIYTGQGQTLTNEVSPAFYYIFHDLNGIQDFSTKPIMTASSWYMPSFGQLFQIFGCSGYLNASIAACGGDFLVNEGCWCGSTEGAPRFPSRLWVCTYMEACVVAPPYGIKNYSFKIRPVRSF